MSVISIYPYIYPSIISLLILLLINPSSILFVKCITSNPFIYARPLFELIHQPLIIDQGFQINSQLQMYLIELNIIKLRRLFHSSDICVL